MRKATTIILTLILSVFLLVSFTGCDKSPKDGLPRPSQMPDLADCEIGYKFEVYPNFAFDYEMADGTIVHIKPIQVTLVEKNEIKEGDIVKGKFYPHKVAYEVSAFTDKSHAGKRIGITYTSTDITTVNEDGSIYINGSWNARGNNTQIYFTEVTWE